MFSYCMRGSVILALGAASLWALPVQAQSRSETHTYDELGRLIVTRTNGGPSNADTRSLCYDEEGNRKRLEMTANGSVVNCPAPPAQTPPPAGGTPPPPPPPPPTSNNPPVAKDDNVSGTCGNDKTLNVIVNDTDADGHALHIVSLTHVAGPSVAQVVSSSSVWITFAGQNFAGTTFDYVVSDTEGATDTGRIFATTTCDGTIQPY